MADYTFDRLNLVRNRASLGSIGIPADAVIFNAPRPIVGTETWTGDFCCGVFYAYLTPTSQQRAFILESNCAMKATVLNFVDEEVSKAQIRAYLKTEYPDDDIGEDLFEEYWRDSFASQFGRDQVTLTV